MQNCYKGNKLLLPKTIYQLEKGAVENPITRAWPCLLEKEGGDLLQAIFLPTVQPQEGLSFWHKPSSLGWTSPEADACTAGTGGLICCGFFWGPGDPNCSILAPGSSFGSYCPVQSIWRGPKIYLC